MPDALTQQSGKHRDALITYTTVHYIRPSTCRSSVGKVISPLETKLFTYYSPRGKQIAKDG